MVMSVLLHDAKAKLLQESGDCLTAEFDINELVYADDTLLIDIHDGALQKYMECVAGVGAEYGLAFNWKKLEVLPVRTTAKIRKADGTHVEAKNSRWTYHFRSWKADRSSTV